MSVNKKLIKPLILDSALGTELENRGEYLPSFKTSIWSAHCLIHKPEVIKQIHIENIEAGADIITTSNYQAYSRIVKKRAQCALIRGFGKAIIRIVQRSSNYYWNAKPRLQDATLQFM